MRTKYLQRDEKFHLQLGFRKLLRTSGEGELYMQRSSAHRKSVKLLLGLLCSDVLSFGYLSLHGQRKVTRSAAGRAEALLPNQPPRKSILPSSTPLWRRITYVVVMWK